MAELVATIKQALEQVEFVLGWVRDPATGAATPARFYTDEEAEAAIFDSTCVHNLVVHLPRLRGRKVGIVAKGCDARSVVELIIELEADRENVKVIGVGCGSILDVKKIWRSFGYGAGIDDTGETLKIDGNEVPRKEFLSRKCSGCLDADPDIYDAFAGESAGEGAAGDIAPGEPDPHPLKAMFDALTPAEKRGFWRDQFSRCIRCYACRDVCPMCFCRDICIMQTQVPHWAAGDVNAKESEMIQLIRVSHMAGRCTSCGECERACPVGIPLMLLLDQQNQAIEEMFDYSPGSSMTERPPMQTFSVEKDLWGDKE